jgi:hypothetical protein
MLRTKNPGLSKNINCPNKVSDGGIRLGPSTSNRSDICVNGMFLNYAAYFKTKAESLYSIIDCIPFEIMPDGGFNCRNIRSGVRHSSLHSTISVLEGFKEFQNSGCRYRFEDIQCANEGAEEFILQHHLFISDRSAKIISKDFLKFTYPFRWKYDILRALDYFQNAASNWDARMEAAINVILKKRNHNGTWNMQAAHPGQVHFIMEKAGKPSLLNTLRAMRILKHFRHKITG